MRGEKSEKDKKNMKNLKIVKHQTFHQLHLKMAAKQEVRSVVALGDSLTEGWNSFQSHPYTTMLQIHLNENLTHGTPPFNVENYGMHRRVASGLMKLIKVYLALQWNK